MNDVQTCILNIYKEIKSLCDRHHIPFFAIGGTCIGAVRHRGFIPWDNDLDIAIPIERYDEFEQLARSELPDYLEIYSCQEVQHYTHLFLKIMDSRTAFIEEGNYGFPDCFKGVYVDVMPASGIPTESKEAFAKTIYRLVQLNRVRRFPIEMMHSKKRRAVWKMMHLLDPVLPFNYFSKKYYRLIRHYPLSTAELTGYVHSGSVLRLQFPAAWFQKTVLLPFEDTEMPCPEEYDRYLTIQFGDYMQPPDEAHRYSGHDGIIDLERSYKDYQDHPEWLPDYTLK